METPNGAQPHGTLHDAPHGAIDDATRHRMEEDDRQLAEVRAWREASIFGPEPPASDVERAVGECDVDPVTTWETWDERQEDERRRRAPEIEPDDATGVDP